MTGDTPEDTGATPPTEDSAQLAEELQAARAEIVALTAERDAERERALRMAAEAENTRRRLTRDKDEAVQYAAAAFARDMLSVADNLARALQSLPADADTALRSGIEATERELVRIFERHGITRVESVGLPLDPNLHEAMVEVEDDAEAGTVVSELQSGWKHKERLLRPALVSVAKAKSEPAGNSENNEEVQ